MFSPKTLDHVVLRVAALEACLNFYQAVLGCTLEKARSEIGLYQLRAGDSIIDLVDTAGPIGLDGGPPPGAGGSNVDHFCIRIEPFDEAQIRRHLAGHGIEAGPVRSNWGADGRGPSLYIEDPAGNTVELKGPPTHPYDPDTGYIASPDA